MAKITNTNSITKAILSFHDVYGNTVNISYGNSAAADINETVLSTLLGLGHIVDGLAYGASGGGGGGPTTDMNTTGATLNGATNQLTLTGDDGMAAVNVDLTALKAVSVADSITGDGTSATPIKLVGDLTTPGNDKYYGTDATGVRGWFIHVANIGHRVVADRTALAALTDLKKGEQIFVEVDSDYGNSWTIWQVKADAATWATASTQILILDKQDSKNFDYAPGKVYALGDLVTYSFSGYQLLIRCSVAHTAPLAGVQSHPDWTKWIVIAQNTPLPDIPLGVIIPVGLTAYVNGRPHYCNTSYTSTGDFQVERVNWNVFEYNHPTTWAAGKYYAPQEHGAYTYTGPCYIVFRNPFSGFNDGFTTGATWNTEDPLKYNYYQLVSQNMYPDYADVANQRVLQRFVVKYNGNLYASKTNFIVPAIFDVLDWDVIVKGGKYKGLYSNTLPYEANDIVIDSNNVLWRSNFDRTVGVWPLQPAEGINSNEFTRLTGKDKGVFNFNNNYIIDDVVYDSTNTISSQPGWYRATAGHSAGNAPVAANWASLARGPNRVHIRNVSAAPAIAGQPTVAEITTAVGFIFPTPPRDTILYYTGDDLPASTPTHVYHIDTAGTVTLLQSPVSGGGLVYRGTFDRTTAPTTLLTNSVYLFDLNPSTGQTLVRLPAATGSGSRIVVGINGLAQPLRVAVQVGESLNGVVDDDLNVNLATYGGTVRLEFIDIGSQSWHGAVLKTDSDTYTSLSYGRIALSTSIPGPSNATSLIPLNVSEINTGTVVEVGSNGLRIPAVGGLYRITAVIYTDNLDDDGAGLSVMSNGVAIKTRPANTLATGTVGIDTITLSFLHVFTGGELVTLNAITAAAEAWEIDIGTYLEVQQQPTTVRYNPASIPINDQTATGYVDIGTMRIQWGRLSTSSPATFNFPVAFANANYSLTITPDGAAGQSNVRLQSRSATNFNLGITNTNDASWKADNFSYLAIGLKP